MSCDAIWSVFTPSTIDRLWAIRKPTEPQTWRREVLSSTGLMPRSWSDADRIRHLRACLSAWDAYLTAAEAVGMLDGAEGSKLMEELRSENDRGFRSGMAECLAAWFLAGRCGFSVSPCPRGRGAHVMDFSVNAHGADFQLEVKAPFRARPSGCWSGDDADALERCLRSANRQFEKDKRNVLLIVPELRRSVYDKRYQLVAAFFGRMKLTWEWSPVTGTAVTPAREEFFPEGSFLKIWGQEGRRFTRVSAVVCVEPVMVAHTTPGGESKYWIDHQAIVAHNPACLYPVPTSLWEGWPQLVLQGDKMHWTDRRPIHD